MYDVSIVIVSWNAKDYLIKCLYSIFKSNESIPFEVIVVDNASNDGSQQAVRSLFPDVTLIENKSNFGFAKANNVGILQSQGKYVALVNSDVEVYSNCFTTLFTFMENNSNIGLTAPKILNANGTVQPSVMLFPSFQMNLIHTFGLNRILPGSRFTSTLFDNRYDYNRLCNVEALSGCFWFIRRSLIKTIDGLDESFFMYGEDIDFCKRVNASGYKVVFNPNAQALHYGGASSNNAPVHFFIELQKANLQYWIKHHGWLSHIIIRCMIFLGQFLRIIPRLIIYLLIPSRRKQCWFKIVRGAACIHYLLFRYNDLYKPSYSPSIDEK